MALGPARRWARKAQIVGFARKVRQRLAPGPVVAYFVGRESGFGVRQPLVVEKAQEPQMLFGVCHTADHRQMIQRLVSAGVRLSGRYWIRTSDLYRVRIAL